MRSTRRRLAIDVLEPARRVEWKLVGEFPAGTARRSRGARAADDGRTVVNFEHGGWPDRGAADGIATCSHTWAMIIDRLGSRSPAARAPYFKAEAPLPN